MADSLTEQVSNLLRRFGKHFSRKVSEIVMILINHRNAGSLGALAGFAIAIAFTWKFLRSPSRNQRNQHKRIGPTSTSSDVSQASEAAVNTEFHQIEGNLSDADAINEFGHSAKLTFGQIVKKKLNGGRKVTCQLLGVILEESTPEELQNHATVRPSVVEVLVEISKYCDIYLMERILDDASGERALAVLEEAGLFKTGGLIKDKVLFCSTENGRMSFVRQIEPDWHVDTNLEIVSQLAVSTTVTHQVYFMLFFLVHVLLIFSFLQHRLRHRHRHQHQRFIRYELHIWPVCSSHTAPNVFSSTSLEQYFACSDHC